MNSALFLEKIKRLGVDFYTGVPDSQLKALCDELYANYKLGRDHIVAANEGAAVGLAAGHYLATGKPALVYMQNSGIGNAINPIASLTNENVYKIPMVFVIGWRGEPGVKDEPQHVFQGKITTALLDVLEIPYYILDQETSESDLEQYLKATEKVLAEEKSVAFVVRKGALTREGKVDYSNSNTTTREAALEALLKQTGEDDIIVSTTGKLSRELFEIRERLGQGHERDFLTVGSMGHASMIAMGIALEKPARTVWCLDGDGAALMHLGSMEIVATTECKNMIHVIFNNGTHETVGGMPVAYGKTDFPATAKAMGYGICKSASSEDEIEETISELRAEACTGFLEIKVANGARGDLGRPTTTPIENKEVLMRKMRIRNEGY